MLTIYAAKGCEKIANNVAEGAALIPNKVVNKPTEFEEQLVLCIEKSPFGKELTVLEPHLAGKKIYLVGIGFSFNNMKKTVETLAVKGVKVENTLCLRRKGFFPFGGEVGEPETARARAFGERIASRIRGIRVSQENEKNRIKNYSRPKQ